MGPYKQSPWKCAEGSRGIITPISYQPALSSEKKRRKVRLYFFLNISPGSVLLVITALISIFTLGMWTLIKTIINLSY